MTDFIVYIDRFVVRDGKSDELKPAMAELVDFVEANEPEILAYDVYFDAEGDRMTVMHMHIDQASLEFHMEVAGPKFPPIGEFIDLESIDVYGHVSEDLVERLRDKASELGSGRVSVHELHRGVEQFRTIESKRGGRSVRYGSSARLEVMSLDPTDRFHADPIRTAILRLSNSDVSRLRGRFV